MSGSAFVILEREGKCHTTHNTLRRSSNSPRYLAPAIKAPMSRETSLRPLRDSGTSPATMRCASPSAIAVLPTPESLVGRVEQECGWGNDHCARKHPTLPYNDRCDLDPQPPSPRVRVSYQPGGWVHAVSTWLSKKDGIVLRAPAENLDCPPDLVIAPNHRIKLPVSGGLCQIPAVLFERLLDRE